MKTAVHYSKPDFIINEETGEVQVDFAYYLDLKSILSESFIKYLLTESKFVKFMNDYEFDSEKLRVFFGTSGVAKCWMEYDKFDASLGMKIADTRAQMKAHYNAMRFINDMCDIVFKIIKIEDAFNIQENNILIVDKSIEHERNLLNN